MSYPSNSVTETLITAIDNLGGPSPTSFGLGELLRDFDNALENFNPGGGSYGNTVVTRSTSATLGTNEVTIFIGSTTGQTLTLPTPSKPATNVVKNYSSVPVALGPGVLDGFGGYISLKPGDAVTLSWNTAGATWYPTGVQQQPAQPVFYWDDFGADPGGTNDSTAAIQAAITAAALGGISQGSGGGASYKISSTLTVGNAIQHHTTTTSGTSGSTLNATNPIAAGFPGSGSISVFTASLTATIVTYTGTTTTGFTGCSSLSGLTASGLYVTAGTLSTQNNILLRGGALNTHSPFGAEAYGVAATTLLWAGASGGTMVEFLGPMTGGGVQNLALECSNLGGIGIYVRAAQSPVIENVAVNNYTQAGIYMTGLTGFPSSEEPGNTTLGNTIFASLRNLSFTTNSTLANTEAIFLDGDGAANTIGSANVTYSTIENVEITLPDPGSTFRNAGIYHRFCDNVVIRNVNVIATTDTPVGAIASFVYDWSVTGAANCPESCLLDGANPSQGYQSGFYFYGSPSGGDPNIITNVRGGATFPSTLTSTYQPFAKWLSDTVHGTNMTGVAGLGNSAPSNLNANAQGSGTGPASGTVEAWIPITYNGTAGWIPFFT